MDKNAVKKFAVNARRKLIDSVSQKAYGLGISTDEIKEVEQIPNGSRIKINNDYVYLTDIETEHRERLIEQIEYKGYEQVMEEVAYTWFNRIIAIRFMEVNDYLPTRIRVLSSEDEKKVEPDAVTQALDLIEELGLDREKIYNYQDNNDTEGLFKYIFIKQCNALGKIMPVMFEKIQDYTELLLPDNLLARGFVIHNLINQIEEKEWSKEVEIIGWMYQYYNTENNELVYGGNMKKSKIPKELLPAATQIFTPNWVVKYMAQNSIGNLTDGKFLDSRKITDNWEYFIEQSEKKELKNIDLENIKIIDPAMGSGHILVCVFDLLMEIYIQYGYNERQATKLIIEKNLYGLDIDDRAAQIANFAIMMRARKYNKRIFKEEVKTKLYGIKSSEGIYLKVIDFISNGNYEIKSNLLYLIDEFKNAKEYGSIIKLKKIDIKAIHNRINYIIENKDYEIIDLCIIENITNKVLPLIEQAEIIIDKYDIVITNPPYLGISRMDKNLQQYVTKNYPYTKFDLSMIFFENVVNNYCKDGGYIAFITINSWMYSKRFEYMRKKVIYDLEFESLVDFGTELFDGKVGHNHIVAWINKKCKPTKNMKAINLSEFCYSKRMNKKKEFFNKQNRYISNQSNYEKIPGIPISYWVTNNVYNIFENSEKLGDNALPKQGLASADNDRFLRQWFEINYNKIGFKIKNRYEAQQSIFKWFPHNKGGNFRRWYGNNEYLINWEQNGYEIKTFNKSVIRNEDFYFKSGYTWSDLTSGLFGARKVEEGFIFDSTGPTMFIKNKRNDNYILGYINSKVFQEFLDITCQGMHYSNGIISNLPIMYIDNSEKFSQINYLVNQNISISKEDWDLFETSWDFKKHPIIEFKSNNIENAFKNWSDFAKEQFNKLKSNEEELNRIFINIYGLQDELTPEVEEKDITIRKSDRDRETKSFISYAVGCMMGRYSLDEEGLVFAGGEFDINRYKTFKADKDAIIPITDMEYFEDDIVSRFVEFVKAVFGEETLEENLNYIADTECFKRKSNETSRDCLRRYFLKGFMEDHIKVYQKRPIYWMFDSGKQNGFKALIYMHRYDENMVAKVRADYLHVLQRKYESEINRLDNDINSDILSTKEKTAAKKRKEKIQKQLAECKQYDQVIAHVAHQRIAIDLDDGVKVNYQKFQGVEVPQGDGKKELKQDLLFKVKM